MIDEKKLSDIFARMNYLSQRAFHPDDTDPGASVYYSHRLSGYIEGVHAAFQLKPEVCFRPQCLFPGKIIKKGDKK